jgi:hypothetical protein
LWREKSGNPDRDWTLCSAAGSRNFQSDCTLLLLPWKNGKILENLTALQNWRSACSQTFALATV